MGNLNLNTHTCVKDEDSYQENSLLEIRQLLIS